MKSPGVLAARKLRRRDGSQASPRLGYVPPPQADETVYSILAAYYRLLRIRPFASPRHSTLNPYSASFICAHQCHLWLKNISPGSPRKSPEAGGI